MDFDPDRSGMAGLRRAVSAAVVPRLTDAIFDASQTYVPVLTGDLRASGRTAIDGDTGYVTYGDADVDYAAYQEFGTSKMAAQPYLRPAAYREYDL